jgi:hypothetical protein
MKHDQIKKKGIKRVIEEVNKIRVHYMYVWKHNKPCSIKKINKKSKKRLKGKLLKTLLKIYLELGVVSHACNPSTWETEAAGSRVRVRDQLGLHSETLS